MTGARRFSRVLIANRGEIAVRLIDACAAAGLETVAVYSDADARAVHVRRADSSVRLGAAPAHESYLNIERVLDAARETGADAIHPGYGFLSENADFADACAQAGIVFIGPSGDAMRASGDKNRAKELAAAADVPTVPTWDIDAVPADAFPVLVKASGGGGGRGMRRVANPEHLSVAVESARREAAAGFADDTLLVEQLLEGARHVEVQLLADEHGTTLYIGDRDCSLQRRHQKVVEEAPAPGLDPALRVALGEAAVRIAQGAGYVSAGTAEFLVARDGSWYFLELNARLQVEHPVTEVAFGIDLVDWQLRIAQGQPLTLSQDEITPIAHAIEARVYAEDPCTYLPTGGRVLGLSLPDTSSVRIDHALQVGGEIPLHYDPLLAKVIASGASREQARTELVSALRRCAIAGAVTNVPLLLHALRISEFVAVTHSIDTLEATPLDPATLEPSAALVRAARHQQLNHEATDAFVALGGWHSVPASTDRQVRHAAIEPPALVTSDGDSVWVCADGGAVQLDRDTIVIADESDDAAAHGSEARLTAPMPGTVISVLDAGETVQAGDAVVVIEAMKMENSITAPFTGRVSSTSCTVGDMVVRGAELALVTHG